MLGMTPMNATASSGSVYLSNAGDLIVDYMSAQGAVNLSSAGSIGTGTPQTCDCTLSISGSSPCSVHGHPDYAGV